MRRGRPDPDDIVWIVVCQPATQPDGPAHYIGPYSAREYCMADVRNAACGNTHWFGHQRWGDLTRSAFEAGLGLAYNDAKYDHRMCDDDYVVALSQYSPL